MNEGLARVLLGVGIPAAVLSLGFGPYLAFRSELPSRIASNFNGSGAPNRSMTPGHLVLVVGVMMLVGLGVCVAVAIRRRNLTPLLAPTVSFVGAFLGAMGAAILATTSIEQRGLDRWQDATMSSWVLLLVVLAGLCFGSIAAWLGSQMSHAEAGADVVTRSVMMLAPGEQAVWSSTLLARWPLLLGLAMLVFAVVSAVFIHPWIGTTLLVSAVAAISLARIRVSADRAGLRVRFGFVGWPRKSIPLHRIERASAIEVRPSQWGGWGYRGSLFLMRQAAVVLRAGPGIRVDLDDGRVFVVTVDDPGTAAALLNSELDRLEQQPTPSG